MDRQRKVSVALQAYAALTTSAARGAVRDVSGVLAGSSGGALRIRAEKFRAVDASMSG